MRTCLISLALFAIAGCATSSSSDATGASNDAITASTTQIVRSAGSKGTTGGVQVGVGLGFSDSSFDSDTKGFCYLGTADQVCAQVKTYEAAMNAAYGQGAHDAIAVQSCAVTQRDNQTVVALKYNLSDDYGDDLDLDKTIAPCGNYEASPAPRTRIYTGGAAVAKDGTLTTTPTLGFHDSTFDGDDKAFCFVGTAADVCPIVSAYAAGMQKASSEGARDTMDLKSCAAAGKIVTTTYALSDDYGGDKTVTATIKSCADR